MAPILTRNNLLILGVFLLTIFLAIRIINSLIQARARTREAWAGIDAQLKRRVNRPGRRTRLVPPTELIKPRRASHGG
jgi:hypothetical protein